MSTTSKLGADMTLNDEQIESARGAADKECPLGPVNVRWYRAFARALLARQPAAIDKQEAVAKRDPGCANCGGKGHVPGDGYGRDDCPVCCPELDATPLANEASKPACAHRIVDARNEIVKSGYLCVDCGAVFAGIHAPAAPSVEQDERYTDEWLQGAWIGWQARAASTSANMAREPDVFEWLETELSAISCRYHGDPSYDHDAYWMRDRALKLIAEARKIFAFARVAQGAEAGRRELLSFDAFWTTLKQKGYQYGFDAADNAYFGYKLAFELPAPPAQTALTDDARECLMDVVSHHHDFRTACIEIKAANETTRSDELYWQKQIDVLDRMKAQAERALTAAQSASGDTK